MLLGDKHGGHQNGLIFCEIKGLYYANDISFISCKYIIKCKLLCGFEDYGQKYIVTC